MARFTVSPAAAHELLPACRLLFPDGAELRRDLLLHNASTSGLFVARDADGKLHAAALVQTLPGALGVAWAPRGDSREAIDATTAAACDWLRSRGVKVCQAFASAEEVPDMIALERHGFRHTTQLVFMERSLTDVTVSERAPALEYQLFSLEVPLLSEQHFPETLRAALLATHEGSLDCPELNAARTPDELLAGFEGTLNTEFDLASLDGNCVGVVLSLFVPEARSAELSYLGVVPTARGHGVGGAMLAHTMGELIDAGCDTLRLSVDARNTPAVRLYARHGFTEDDRREVWLATWAT